LAAAVRHGGSLGTPFFADDYLFLEQVRGRSLLQALLAPDAIGNFLRPVSRALYFWTVTAIAGESPPAFHAVNLGLFAACIVLLHLIVRRMFGVVAATVAAAFVGIHYAAEVPLLWVSGSQDLLALVFALATIWLTLRERFVEAAGVLVLALLSKESVALTAPIAVVALMTACRTPWREALRRCLPLLLVTGVWAMVYATTIASRPAVQDAVALSATSLIAGFAHLPQVALALEFPATFALPRFDAGMLVAAILVLGALAMALFLRPGGEAHEGLPGGRRLGLVWAIAASLPVLLVASIWSAYFYVFALCGVGVLAGVSVARVRRAVALALGAAFVVLNANASGVRAFSSTKSATSSLSHVNAFYVRRSVDTVERFLAQMQAAQPRLPKKSTVFFANVPSSIGFQTADGPLVRFAYRDPSLRSYYLTQFTPDRARGPFFFFAVEGGRLVDKTADPMLLPSIALSMMLEDKHQAASDVLSLVQARGDAPELATWLALTQWGAGDLSASRRTLERLGISAAPLPTASRKAIRVLLAAGDSSRARDALLAAQRAHPLDPWVEARVAAIALGGPRDYPTGLFAAYAYRVLAPADPDAWRKWATAQLSRERYESAASSLDKYFELGGDAARKDAEAVQVRASLRELLSGTLEDTPADAGD
jgi:hypothetical protein